MTELPTLAQVEATMLETTMLTTLAGYHRWATERILDGAAHLSEAQYHAVGAAGERSVHDILFHMLRVDHVWRNVCAQPGAPFTPLAPADHPDLAAIRAAWAQDAVALGELLAGLTDAELAAVVEIRDWQGRTSQIERWRTLAQLFLHGMQHRSEIAQALTAHGYSPGDIDFIIYTLSQ